MTNYEVLIRDNLARAFEHGTAPLEERLPAVRGQEGVNLQAFGAACRITPEAVFLDERPETGPLGLVLSLYALHAAPEALILEPMIAFRDFSDSMPYRGPFSANTERPLIPHVSSIQAAAPHILKRFGRDTPPPETPGDFSLLLFPLPKISLCYIFYLPDEEFPASATCLFSHNALRFLPLDGLADTAEYTTKKLLHAIDKVTT